MTVTPSNTSSGAKREPAGADPHLLAKVRSIFVSLSKYLGARTIYEPNSPIVEKFGRLFTEALQEYFRQEKELTLSVEQYQLRWREETVYDNREKKESIAFLLFKDGVGEITIHDGVGLDELERFVGLILAEICSSSSGLDIVDRLWQADFTRISYRVYDEAAEERPGEGPGIDGGSAEQRLSLNDHENLAGGRRAGRISAERSDEALGTHLLRIVERDHPEAGAGEKERHLQRLLEALFEVSDGELEAWRDGCSSFDECDRLMMLLDFMLDFTGARMPGEVVCDVIAIVERLVAYVAEEMDMASLFALVGIQNDLAGRGDPAPGFEAVPQRIRHALTNRKFLLSLARKAGRSRADGPQILQYLAMFGDNAVPALREILSVSKDPAFHERTCDLLFGIAKEYLMPVVEDLDLEDPLEARDAVGLLVRLGGGEVPEVIGKIVASPDARVRIHAVEYLAVNGSEEASRLLCRLLDDADAGIRLAAIAAAEDLSVQSVIDTVTSLCFGADVTRKPMEEQERLFRALGKLAGAAVLPRILEMSEERSFLSINRGRARRAKLLAVTALRQIPGPEAHEALTRLAGDGDTLVRSKAQHALAQHAELEQVCAATETADAEGGEG